MADLDIFIQRSEEAVDEIPADHPNRADQFQSLGIGYGDRYQRTSAMSDLEIAIQRYEEALDNSLSSINDQLKSGRTLLILQAEAENWPQASQAAFKTVSLIPSLTPRFLENSDKQHLLTDIANLPSECSENTI